MILERAKIERIMPHRESALFLDKIEVADDRKTAVGYLNLRLEHCRGHFPGNPIMRAVDRREMVAQTLGMTQFEDYPEGVQMYLAADGKGEYRSTATVGDLVIAEVVVTRVRTKSILGNGTVKVGSREIADIKDVLLITQRLNEYLPSSSSAQKRGFDSAGDQILTLWRMLSLQERRELFQHLQTELPPVKPGFVTISMASRVLKLSTSRLRQIVTGEDNILGATKEGNVWYIPEDSIKRFTPPGRGRLTKPLE